VGDDDGEDEVSEEVRARCSKGGEVGGGEEEFEEEGESIGVVEVDEERPVKQPTPSLKLSEISSLSSSGGARRRWSSSLGHGSSVDGESGSGTRVDEVLDLVDALEGLVPGSGEDVGGELSPVSGKVEVGIGGEDEEMVEVLGCTGVVSVGVLELSVVVESEDGLGSELGGKERRESKGGQFQSFRSTRNVTRK